MDTIINVRAANSTPARNLFHAIQTGPGPKTLQPGASVDRIVRENGIKDNLLFTWRQRYRHLVDAPADQAADALFITDDNFVLVVVETQPQVVSATPVPAPPPKPVQVCEITIGRACLRLSGNFTPAMLSALVRELNRGRL